MQSLYILRHGDAVPHGTPGFADDDRPLTEKGEKQMRRMSKGLRRLKLDLERIVTSPLPRAQRTAEIVAEVLDLENRIEVSEALSTGQGASAIREWLARRSEGRLMIVGHNPCLSDLVTLLATGSTPSIPFCNLEKGGIAAFRIDESNPEWIELQWLTTPKLIQRLSD